MQFSGSGLEWPGVAWRGLAWYAVGATGSVSALSVSGASAK